MLASVEMLKKERERDFKLGETHGKTIGRTEGVKLGRKREKISLAKKMVKENFAIEIIEKITGLKREKFM